MVYPLRLSLNPFSLHGQDVDVSFFIDAMYRFYVSKYKDEYLKFFTSGHADQIRQEIAPMSLEIANLKTNETLVRIGHFSHVECVTLDNVRKPKTREVKGKPMPYGTTRTLANGLYPFGWAKLEFKDLESLPRKENNWPFSKQELIKVVDAKENAAKKPPKTPVVMTLEDELAHFQSKLNNTSNLPGEIDTFLEKINSMKDKKIKEELCRALVAKANSLPKKKKYSKALNAEKKWAVRLNKLCKEIGLEG